MSQHPDRRTFAIISHPDAGKTTLTENLLVAGGAIHIEGEVKARGQARRARSDWMKIEQQRGISVTSSVMTFEHTGLIFTLLDRSAACRVGKECVHTCRSRCSPYHSKKQQKNHART